MIHDEIKKALDAEAAGIHVSRPRLLELLRAAEVELRDKVGQERAEPEVISPEVQ